MLTIPQENYSDVVDGLQHAFGVTEIEDIRKLPSGLSSDLVFRIVVRASPYVLRIMTRINEYFDPNRIFACMTAAAAANFVLASDVEQGAYLEEYFGHAPDSYESARFFLMRQVVHMLAATVFLRLGSAGKPIDKPADLPRFPDFHRRMWAGEVDLGDNAQKIVYGLLHWEALRNNVRQTRFDEAIAIAAERNASQPATHLLLPSAPA
jgi:hypothetical protein